MKFNYTLMKYSDEELIEELHRVSEEHCEGESPRQKDMIDDGKFSAATYERRFESWNDILEKSGVGVNVYKDYSKSDIKSILIKTIEEDFNGEVPSRNEFNREADIHYSTIDNYFETWNKALQSCGFEVNEKHNLSRDFLKQEIFRVSDIIGEVPTIEQINELAEVSIVPYETEFGSWNKALEICGMEYNHKNNIGKEYIKKELKRVSEQKCDGKAPKREDMKEYSDICQRTATIKFGTWRNALKESGVEPLKPEEYLPTGEDHHAWKGGYSVNYGSSWYSQRKKAIKRDNFSCRKCGEKNSIIDVHHITPIRYWDIENEHEKMNALHNLISLCRLCHNKYEDKFKGRSHKEFENKIKE